MESNNNQEKILTVKNLKTSFMTQNGEVQAIRGINFELGKGDILGIVGESGSGKSVTSMSILQLLSDTAKIKEGEITFKGENIVAFNKKQIRDIRGNKIAMVFQDPMSSLNPLMKVGEQIGEMIYVHNRDMKKQEIHEEVIRLMNLVRIPEPEKRVKSYPHQFSGGMRQRVMIAMALACKPDVLIADEPTTALDVTIQDQILKLLKSLQAELGMSIIFITHDLGVVAELCNKVIVMYGGLVMESALIDDLFEKPSHPYTLGLLGSMPNIHQDKNTRLIPIKGIPPNMLKPPVGCPFAMRCTYARNICDIKPPNYVDININSEGSEHKSFCWLHDQEAPTENNPFKNNLKGGATVC